MKRAAPGDEDKGDNKPGDAKSRGVADVASDDWMETMPEALRKQMQ